jgi:hypothetical protein
MPPTSWTNDLSTSLRFIPGLIAAADDKARAASEQQESSWAVAFLADKSAGNAIPIRINKSALLSALLLFRFATTTPFSMLR